MSLARIAKIAAAIVFLCCPSFLALGSVRDLQEPNTMPVRTRLDLPGSTTVKSTDRSRKLSDDARRGSVDVLVRPVIKAMALADEIKFNIKSGPTGLEIPAAVRVPLSRHMVHRDAAAQQSNLTTVSGAQKTSSRSSEQLAANVDRISYDTPTLAPVAFVRFCMRYPLDCAIRELAFHHKPIVLTKIRKTELKKVNRGINRTIKPHKNLDGVMMEEWLIGPLAGDCNDYAVTKRHKLLALGWPSQSLLLSEVVVPSGAHHLVLVVRTRDEDLVLDNLNRDVRPASQIHYKWLRAQQPKNPKLWSIIHLARSTHVATNRR
jgi:predicted transglutaminase-like cysteine proteinase